MKRLLLLLAFAAPAFAVPVAHAQILTAAPNGAATAGQVLALGPQLLTFAGSDTNFANLVNGLALGIPVTLTTPLPTGGSQVFAFTPSGTMSAVEIAQTLEKARQALISRGVATPTAQQIGTVLAGGSLTTASGTTGVTPIINTASTAASNAAAGASLASGGHSPASAIQQTTSAPSTNAAAGSRALRNMSDSPFPRGISDTPPQPVPGVTTAAPNTALGGTPATTGAPAGTAGLRTR
jgi:hypothetical protein